MADRPLRSLLVSALLVALGCAASPPDEGRSAEGPTTAQAEEAPPRAAAPASPGSEASAVALPPPAAAPEALSSDADAAWLQEIETFRFNRDGKLRSPTGWLALAGLHWLEPGPNPFGCDPTLPIRLPEGSAPPLAGTLYLEGETVRLVAEPGAGMMLGTQEITERVLQNDRETALDVVRMGRLGFQILRRGDRFALRVRDEESPVLTSFTGVETYPPDPAFRVEARLERYLAPRAIELPGVNDTTSSYLIPGMLRFTLGGREVSLEPLVDRVEDTTLFLIFRDATSGTETYGSGRYLYANLDGDRAILDFNKAYNPPCAFTPYATCPLAPPENRLDVPVRAGEKAYRGGHD